MSGLINFIKGIFSAIFGIFGGKKEGAAKAKKSKGYFLELDDAKGVEAPAQPAAAAATPAPATASQASPRQEKRAALANAAQAQAAPAPAPAAPAPAPAPKKPVPTEVNFATKYLVPANTGGRRRPGANMTSYLSMARQVKVS